MSCDAFSSSRDTLIIWPEWKPDKKLRVTGTSISLASSFINFLEINSEKFTIIDKPTEFSFDEVVWVWKYTRKTSFDFTLKLKTTNIWLLQ
jgi:hypothetical protein